VLRALLSYVSRQGTNPSYGQRAFGRRLGINPGAFSEILQNKRTVTVATAKKILANLNHAPGKIERFLDEVKPKRTGAKKVFHHLSLGRTAEEVTFVPQNGNGRPIRIPRTGPIR
jgi:hypothetical protein